MQYGMHGVRFVLAIADELMVGGIDESGHRILRIETKSWSRFVRSFFFLAVSTLASVCRYTL